MKTIFDVLKNIMYLKDETNLGTKLYEPYMINRILSCDANYVSFSSFMNRNSHISKEMQESFLFYVLPKKNVFIKYIKGKKTREDAIKAISDEMNISYSKAEEYLEFLNKLNDRKNGLEMDMESE